MVLAIGHQRAPGLGAAEVRLGPHLWPGPEGWLGVFVTAPPAPRGRPTGWPPGPCRRSIGTSCASQMFLVYPQMCVAGSPPPWPPHLHRGAGLGPRASQGGGHIFVGCGICFLFRRTIESFLERGQVVPLLGPQSPHHWDLQEPPRGKERSQAARETGPGAVSAEGGSVQARV